MLWHLFKTLCWAFLLCRGPRVRWSRFAGVKIYRLHITWWDLWKREWCFEIAMEERRRS